MSLVVVCRVLDDEDSQPASFWPQATKKEAEMGDVEMQKRGIKWPSSGAPEDPTNNGQ
jgi:hypothetical protein